MSQEERFAMDCEGYTPTEQATPTPRTDALVEKHQRELGGTRKMDDPTPLLRLAQDQAIESMEHARQLERELAAKTAECARFREAMQEFVDRCDRNEVRSRYTVARFRAALKDSGND